MTDEEKELLLKDLCARVPYNIICKAGNKDRKLLMIDVSTSNVVYLSNEDYLPKCYMLDEIKPYLRPMKSMTEEEEKEFLSLGEGLYYNTKTKNVEYKTDRCDWLDRKMFDYRGLIPMGLALPATEGMYK